MGRLKKVVLYVVLAAALGQLLARVRDDADATAEAVEGGRFASSPLEMTWVGWKDIFNRAAYSAIDDKIMTVAASVAFYSLLSLVPGLSVLVTVYGLFASPTSIPGELALLTDFMPDAARALVHEQAVRLAGQSNGSLSLTLLISLSIAGWSANAAVKALFEAMNVMWGKADTRSFIQLNLETLLFTLAGILVAAIAVVTLAGIPALVAVLPFPPSALDALSLIRWPIFYLTGLAAIVLVYRRGPCRKPPSVIWILPGAIVASLVWLAASALFSWYVSTLASYTATYGSLAAVIVLLTWMWLSTIILLAGAEINAQIEHQIAHAHA